MTCLLRRCRRGPALDQLRRRAKELRDAARSGDPAALGRVAAHPPASGSGTVTLAAAQLAIAREHGYPSWPQLVAEVQARTAEAGQQADEFLAASIGDWTGRAARMLARDPWLAGYDFRTAIVLGDAAQVGAVLARDPGLATRPDDRTGWTALHAACASRWHQLDPARADGLTEVARLLLDAGADPTVTAPPFARPDEPGRQWSPLLCAVAGEPNPGITRLLLDHGARPDDHVLYLAAFDADHECLRLVLPYAPDITATTALSAPISTGDITAARLLLEAGADPNHLLDASLLGDSHAQSPPVPPLSAAIALEAGPELAGLLLQYGAALDVPGPDGRMPYQRAVRTGQDQVAELLARHGASTVLSPADEFLAACRRADRGAATAVLAATPDLAAQLSAEDHRILTDAADHGDTAAVRLMLDLGFPPGTRSEQDDGATALAPRSRRRQHRHRPAAARARRGYGGPRHYLGQHPAGMGPGRQRHAARPRPVPGLARHRRRPARRGRLHQRDHPVARRPQTAQPRSRRPAARPRHPRARQHDARQTTLAGAELDRCTNGSRPVTRAAPQGSIGYAAGIRQLRPEQAVRAPVQLAAGGMLAAFAGIRVAGRYHAYRAHPDGLRGDRTPPGPGEQDAACQALSLRPPPRASCPSVRAPRRNVSGIGITSGPARRRSR
ncbi:MAG TPA: hypothetical protein VFQ68_08620 [Streptosporangiaceae bacterium]|nr:hypothetical protein [Streptosporangiaceae bacterium]